MPVTLRLSHPLRDRELIDFSHRNRPFRIEQNSAGELEIMPPLGFDDALRETFVTCKVGNWGEENGGLSFSSNVGVLMRDRSVRSPDACWMSQERWDSLSKAEQEGFAPLCPEFLIEILPKTDFRPKLEEKMAMWIANGAQLAWMIDPFEAEVLVYRQGQEVERLLRPEWVEAEEVVPGFRLDMARLWVGIA